MCKRQYDGGVDGYCDCFSDEEQRANDVTFCAGGRSPSARNADGHARQTVGVGSTHSVVTGIRSSRAHRLLLLLLLLLRTAAACRTERGDAVGIRCDA